MSTQKRCEFGVQFLLLPLLATVVSYNNFFSPTSNCRPEWLHAFYLGKLCEKLGYSPARSFSYYAKAGELNPTAVDPVYRLHASRLKLLYTRGKQSDVLQVFSFSYI